jgi:glutathione S-transferase
MMQLYGHPFSSYTWKVLIALYGGDVPFDFRMLGQDQPENHAVLHRATPLGKFPLLRDGETEVFEATAIIEYLWATQPSCAGLIPEDRVAAARLRMLDRVFDNYVMANMQRVVGAHRASPGSPDQAEIAAAKDALARAYRWIEAWLAAEGEPPAVTLLTCAAAPSLFYADWVQPIAGQGFTRLAAWRSALLALPPVALCVEAARPYRPWFPPGAPDRD